MLALFLFAVVEEDVDESAAAAVEDMEVLMTLGGDKGIGGSGLASDLYFLTLVYNRLTHKKG